MSANKQPTPAQVAEAAAWVAHLHGSRRTPDSERGLQLWLKEDSSRVRVWEIATEEWENIGNLRGAAIAEAIQSITRANSRRENRGNRYFAVAAVIAVVVATAIFWTRFHGITTAVGEQRIVALEDGTRITLNTASRIVVRYDQQVRKVELKSGEARFDVARQAARPFIVTAGDRQVEALGTSFVVRYDTDHTAVTLVDGKVSVSSAGGSTGAHPQSAAVTSKSGRSTARNEIVDTPDAPVSGTAILTAGQRLIFANAGAPKFDTPELDKVTAWQRGEVVMDGMRLREAISEMNRYSERRLTVDHAAAESLVVSGVFRSGDSVSFANAVAHTYQLRVIEKSGEIVLTGNPKAAYR